MAVNADAAPAMRPKHGLADQHWRAALQFDNRRNKPALSRPMRRGPAVVGEDTLALAKLNRTQHASAVSFGLANVVWRQDRQPENPNLFARAERPRNCLVDRRETP